ncbi:hypothetical protein OA092_00105, partial [bacterium]|nr:hypothetical protein [bacterium]MDC3064561.1 hypothetical protein [bacterium]
MGFTIKTLDLCDYLSKDFFGSTVISLGNPFISNKVLRESNINISNAKKIINIDRNSRSHYLFKEIYKVEEFNILDISDEEGAQFIHDLNDPINNLALLNKFDFVLDFGTQEHVFNNSTFLLNVFNLLNNRGKYIFVLPGNSDLEHGFRQFSPTFFYDLCYANNQSLSIEWLSLHSKRCNLNMLPLYQKIDKNSYQKISNASQSLNALASNHGSLTGTSVSLINQLGAQ